MIKDNLQTGLQALEQRLRELLENHKEQQKVVQQLQQEREQLGQGGRGIETSLDNFSKSLKSGTITRNEEQIRELGSSIDRYIRDIDKCIAYLEQL